VSWSDGVLTASRQDTNVTANLSVTANFAINTYTLSYSAATGGSIVGSSTQVVSYGSSGTTVTATPSTGYHFVSWSDGVATASRQDTNVTANLSVTANFAINTYAVTASAGANGSASPASQVVTYGANATVTVTPAVGYHIATITVDGSPVAANSPVLFTNVTAGHVVAATFAVNTFAITPTSGAGGSVTPSTVQTVPYGGSATFQITPNAGFRIGTVVIDGTNIGTPTSYTFANVSATHTISATFVQAFTITVSSGANGTISPGTQTLDVGSQMAFAVVPNAGYHIATLTVDSVSIAPTGTVVFNNLSANHTLSATFAPDVISVTTTYTITAAAGANGVVSPLSQTVNSGDNATVTVTPNTGYHIAAILVDGSPTTAVSPVVLTNVTAPHTVSATFAINTYSLAPTAGPNGTISPSTTQTVDYGATATFTITPNVGYHIATVTVDGSPVAATSPMVLSNVTADHTVVVTFSATPKVNTTVTIQSDSYSVAFPHTFILTGLLTPGAYLDPVVVEVQKPNQSPSVPWSYSSNRLCYETVGGSGHWWYRYAPLLRGTYHFRARFLGDATRNPSVSSVIAVVVH